MRAPLVLLTVLGLAACAPSVPESGPGFQDYNSYMREREAQLNGTAPAGPSPLGATAAPAGGFSLDRVGAAINAAEGGTTLPPPASSNAVPLSAAPGPVSGTRPRGDAPMGIQVESGEMAAVNRNSAGMSDEQDFDSVASRETIESDRERLARQRAEYQVIQPTAVLERHGGAGPNIVQFAISTSHAPGTQMYRRSSIRLNAADAGCGRFSSPDLAQEAFLAAGGPERDRKNMDSDGDGFACGWDPRPFRQAAN